MVSRWSCGLGGGRASYYGVTKVSTAMSSYGVYSGGGAQMSDLLARKPNFAVPTH